MFGKHNDHKEERDFMKQKTKSGFSLYINSNENFQNALILEQRKKKYRIGLIIAFVIIAISCLLTYHYRVYHSIKIVKTISKDLAESSQSFSYKKGTICYSEDGIYFLDGNGNEKWNRTYSIKNPQATYCGNYIVIASKNGNEIALLDGDGQMKKFSVSYPIIDVEVAKQGVIALILHGDTGNYIELYDAAQKKLVSIKVTADQNGYPMDITLSSDGQNLLVSYLVVDGINTKSRVALYNFGSKGEEKGDQLIGGFDFKDCVIPKISFMGDSKAVAIADDQLIFFKIGKTISKTNDIAIDKTIKSVALNDQYVGLVLENQKKSEQERYQSVIYNRNGRKLMTHDFSSEYNKVLLGEREMVLAGNYHFETINFSGHVMYQKDFKKRISNVSLTGKKRRYLITYENSIELFELR